MNEEIKCWLYKHSKEASMLKEEQFIFSKHIPVTLHAGRAEDVGHLLCI